MGWKDVHMHGFAMSLKSDAYCSIPASRRFEKTNADDWEHVIALKAVTETDIPLPHLLKAQNGCPPEDCGGPRCVLPGE